MRKRISRPIVSKQRKQHEHPFYLYVLSATAGQGGSEQLLLLKYELVGSNGFISFGSFLIYPLNAI
jgi:hypothetical protein